MKNITLSPMEVSTLLPILNEIATKLDRELPSPQDASEEDEKKAGKVFRLCSIIAKLENV